MPRWSAYQGIYMPDGRLLIQFRDNTPRNRPGNQLSPTEGDWVGWVGSWDNKKGVLSYDKLSLGYIKIHSNIK